MFGLTTVPTTLVVDRFGKVAMLMVDVKTDPASYDRIFDYFCSDDYTQSVWLTSLPPVRVSVVPSSDEELTKLLTDDQRINCTCPESTYVWPFMKGEENGICSSNSDIDDSVCSLTASVSAPEGSVFSYRFCVSSEKLYDALMISLDGKEVRVYSGETGWQKDAMSLSAGEHEIVTIGEDASICEIVLSTVKGANIIVLFNNDITVVPEIPVNPIPSRKGIFNLNGQEFMEMPERGIIIIDGKKVRL